MAAQTIITWEVGRGRNCSHKSVSFLDDDHVAENIIETDDKHAVARVQVIRPFVQVICEDCGQRGVMSVRGDTEVHVESGEIQLQRT